eukprot:scaffold377628_cov17-Prasinocladus_malaysianus.AAC.1
MIAYIAHIGESRRGLLYASDKPYGDLAACIKGWTGHIQLICVMVVMSSWSGWPGNLNGSLMKDMLLTQFIA